MERGISKKNTHDGIGENLIRKQCFYKEIAPDPHLHIRERPRCDKTAMINENSCTDREFGHRYALNKRGAIPVEDKKEVFIRLKEWLNRNQLSELFGRDIKTIGKHIGNALKEELRESEVVAKFATTTRHGAIDGKTQTHLTEYYNLDKEQ